MRQSMWWWWKVTTDHCDAARLGLVSPSFFFVCLLLLFLEQRECVCVALPWVNIKSSFSPPDSQTLSAKECRGLLNCAVHCHSDILSGIWLLYILLHLCIMKITKTWVWICKNMKARGTTLFHCFILQRFSAILPSSQWCRKLFTVSLQPINYSWDSKITLKQDCNPIFQNCSCRIQYLRDKQHYIYMLFIKIKKLFLYSLIFQKHSIFTSPPSLNMDRPSTDHSPGSPSLSP